MKKFLIAAAASLLVFGGQANIEAASFEKLNPQGAEIQNVSSWTEIRDRVLGRKREKERRNRKDWERRHDYDGRHNYRDDYRYQPPPPPRHNDRQPPPRR